MCYILTYIELIISFSKFKDVVNEILHSYEYIHYGYLTRSKGCDHNRQSNIGKWLLLRAGFTRSEYASWATMVWQFGSLGHWLLGHKLVHTAHFVRCYVHVNGILKRILFSIWSVRLWNLCTSIFTINVISTFFIYKKIVS